MRKLPLAAAAALTAVAAPAMAADLNVTVEIPRLNTASYHRPYVAIWIEQPDQTAVRTLAVWYQVAPGRGGEGEGKDWLKDMRTWWRKGGRSLTLPADGLSGIAAPWLGARPDPVATTFVGSAPSPSPPPQSPR